ncbi:hypothetical protein F2S72_09375 [Pseudomonas syringae pv. actinidiae]|nr:hypothetical protein [Pseudomonas syringae pv. actinidiae]
MQKKETSGHIAPVTHAAYAHVETVVAQADAHQGASPLWHGWAIQEAFEAGAEWQRSQAVKDDPSSVAAKLSSAVAVLRKVEMTPLDSWYRDGLNVEVAQILRDNEPAPE